MIEIVASMYNKQRRNYKLALSGIVITAIFATSLLVLGSLQSLNVSAVMMGNETGSMNPEKGMMTQKNGIMMNPKTGMMMDNKTGMAMMMNPEKGMMMMINNKTGMMVTMNTQTGMVENKTDMMISMDPRSGMPMLDSKTTGEMMNPETGKMMGK